ncbi:hypothetical protein BU15DRAFT_67756 [Melanogaster broomeanus]|nr:hypothetical protein BU15DRAFT_67756 [Melanogaster broomeanus]
MAVVGEIISLLILEHIDATVICIDGGWGIRFRSKGYQTSNEKPRPKSENDKKKGHEKEHGSRTINGVVNVPLSRSATGHTSRAVVGEECNSETNTQNRGRQSHRERCKDTHVGRSQYRTLCAAEGPRSRLRAAAEAIQVQRRKAGREKRQWASTGCKP